MVKELIQGLGGFDGKASSVSAVDLLGLLGTEGATSTVQALIDVIADKVLNQLLLKSNVVNNALTTEEGYALDARMGKSLQDQITAQNSNLSSFSLKTFTVDVTEKSSLDGKYYVERKIDTEPWYSSAKAIIPLYARKSGDSYVCIIEVEHDTLRVQADKSISSVFAGIMVIS